MTDDRPACHGLISVVVDRTEGGTSNPLHTETPKPMTRRQGNMFDEYEKADLFCVTANSYVRDDGALTMGAGAAKQLRVWMRPQPYAGRLGSFVEMECGHLGVYGLLEADGRIALFQTKTHWKQKARLEVIGKSAMQLIKWTAKHPRGTVYLNYPGIGCGGLQKSRVRPIIEELPDTVHVWTRE